MAEFLLRVVKVEAAVSSAKAEGAREVAGALVDLLQALLMATAAAAVVTMVARQLSFAQIVPVSPLNVMATAAATQTTVAHYPQLLS